MPIHGRSSGSGSHNIRASRIKSENPHYGIREPLVTPCPYSFFASLRDAATRRLVAGDILLLPPIHGRAEEADLDGTWHRKRLEVQPARTVVLERLVRSSSTPGGRWDLGVELGEHRLLVWFEHPGRREATPPAPSSAPGAAVAALAIDLAALRDVYHDRRGGRFRERLRAHVLDAPKARRWIAHPRLVTARAAAAHRVVERVSAANAAIGRERRRRSAWAMPQRKEGGKTARLTGPHPSAGAGYRVEFICHQCGLIRQGAMKERRCPCGEEILITTTVLTSHGQ